MKKWIELWFTQHELWALNSAEQLPIIALYFNATLWIWALPVIPFILLYSRLMIEWPIATFIPTLILVMGFFFFVAPWFFSWYFISVGLMFGRTKMAIAKRKRLEKRLSIS